MTRFALLLVFALLATPALAGEVINDTKQPSVLFVVSAAGGSVQGETVVLDSPSPVIYFSDRPARVAGHITPARFAALWESDGPDSFKTDPPNAVISFPGQQGEDVVVELLDATVKADTLRLTVRPIRGSLPAKLPECAVFVDHGIITGTLGVFGHMGG